MAAGEGTATIATGRRAIGTQNYALGLGSVDGVGDVDGVAVLLYEWIEIIYYPFPSFSHKKRTQTIVTSTQTGFIVSKYGVDGGVDARVSSTYGQEGR